MVVWYTSSTVGAFKEEIASLGGRGWGRVACGVRVHESVSVMCRGDINKLQGEPIDPLQLM